MRAVRQPDGVFECRSGCSCRGIAGPTPSSAGKRAMVTGGLREELSEIWVYVGIHSYFEHQSGYRQRMEDETGDALPCLYDPMVVLTSSISTINNSKKY